MEHARFNPSPTRTQFTGDSIDATSMGAELAAIKVIGGGSRSVPGAYLSGSLRLRTAVSFALAAVQ
ncbi:MAG TPA: hypothetical protein PLX89_12070 [Verrucomicrobiota bacterium]|nr:hypothetical protein [Verrucomicrobiota bacterium]